MFRLTLLFLLLTRLALFPLNLSSVFAGRNNDQPVVEGGTTISFWGGGGEGKEETW